MFIIRKLIIYWHLDYISLKPIVLFANKTHVDYREALKDINKIDDRKDYGLFGKTN